MISEPDDALRVVALTTDALGIERLMSAPVLAVIPSMQAHAALELAIQRGLHHLPVIDHQTAVGMVCTCDLEDAIPTESVGSRMHSPVHAVPPGTSDSAALELMNQQCISSLLVTQGGHVLGIVTRRDLMLEGTPLLDDARGFCGCCGAIAHLREHSTGRLCAECLGRAHVPGSLDSGGEG